MLRPPFHARRDGFTLIEILFALALIAILASILFLAGSAVLGGTKEKSTKVTLAALKGMMAEYDAKTRLTQSPKFWLWYDPVSGATVPKAVTSDEDFWKVPGRDPGSAPTPRAPMPLDAPGLVTAGTYDANPDQTSVDELTRNGSRQVLNTQLAMSRIFQMEANRAALAKLPPESYFVPRWVGGTNRLATPGADGVLYYDPDGTGGVFYPQGAKVTVPDGGGFKGFICISGPPSNPLGIWPSGMTPPTVGSDWALDNSPATPILLDAWGNPILFVPGSGLRVRLLNGKETLLQTGPDAMDQVMIIVSPEGKVEKQVGFLPKVLQPGRPFFASAGADGDFAKGDDNIYSFEQ